MLAVGLDRAGTAQQLGLAHPGRRDDVGEGHPALGYRAGLVEHQGGDPAAALQHLDALDQHAELRAPPGADHDRHRCRQPERARAGDDQHRDRGDQAVLGVAADLRHRPGGERQRGDRDHHGDEHGRDPVGQALRLPLGGLRLLDQPHDLRQGGLGADPGRPHGEHPAGVDGRPGHVLAGGLLHGDGLAGQHRLVDRARAVDDLAVGWDLLARPDPQQVTDADLLDWDEHLGAVAEHPGLLGAQLQQGADGLAGPSLGARLDVAAKHQEGDDDRRRLEVQVHAAGSELDQRVAVGRQGAHGDQGVHVGGAAACPPGRLVQERPADPELHRGGERERGQPRPRLAHPVGGAGQHRQGEHRRQRGADQQAPQPSGGGLRLGLALPVGGLGWAERDDAVADLVDGRLQLVHGDGGLRVHRDMRPAGGEVDLSLGHAALPAEHPLNTHGTRPAGHPLDLKVDRHRYRLRRSRLVPCGLSHGAATTRSALQPLSTVEVAGDARSYGWQCSWLRDLVALLLDDPHNGCQVHCGLVVGHGDGPCRDVDLGGGDSWHRRQRPLDRCLAVVTVNLRHRDRRRR